MRLGAAAGLRDSKGVCIHEGGRAVQERDAVRGEVLRLLFTLGRRPRRPCGA